MQMLRQRVGEGSGLAVMAAPMVMLVAMLGGCGGGNAERQAAAVSAPGATAGLAARTAEAPTAARVRAAAATHSLAAGTPAQPVLFVTSVPGFGFEHQLNTFANQGSSTVDAVAGGDLFIRYPDGTLRNLTAEAGWGVPSGGIQGGPKAISVRQPSMHWNGRKAVFSMMVGGPTARYQLPDRRWQLYEVTGLGQGEAVKISRVADQPSRYNNLSPIYGSDDNLIFVSDAPLYGMKNTYPQRDEYESAHSNTGIWKLDRETGRVTQLQHAPSGVFDLHLDSSGRLLFTKWDHLKRDQQADADRYDGGVSGAVDYAKETASRVKVFPARDGNGQLQADARGVLYEQFPEARRAEDPTRRANESLHDFNVFAIWQINEDGSEEETLNHVGRHEFFGIYMPPVFFNDPNLSYVLPGNIANVAMRDTLRGDAGLFQLREDPNRPGTYLATYSQEFARQASGRIVEFHMPPGLSPEDVVMIDHTNATLDQDPYGEHDPQPTMTGHYRNPLPLSSGGILVSHTPEYRMNSPTAPYVFQLKPLVDNPLGDDQIAGASLTGGIVKDIRYWTDDAQPRRYVGPLNEHDAVEVKARVRPYPRSMTLAAIEKQVLADEGVDETTLRTWLRDRGLAMIVSRNLTLRDRADRQQPFNLRVPGGVKNLPRTGTVYDIQGLQIFQGDLTRGYNHGDSPGRRVFARPVHNSDQHPDVARWYPADAPAPGTVKLGADGSMAAIVPAGRALSWQLVSPTGVPVVRERVWVSFAPGEVRTCASCHGINTKTLNGQAEPTNPPQALRDLLTAWKAAQGSRSGRP